MRKYFEDSFYFQKKLIKKTASLTEVSDTIEEIRKQLRVVIPNAMEVCILLLADVADLLSNIILSARQQWQTTQEKIKISQMLSNITPFVPNSVRQMANKDPGMLNRGKKTLQFSMEKFIKEKEKAMKVLKLTETNEFKPEEEYAHDSKRDRKNTKQND